MKEFIEKLIERLEEESRDSQENMVKSTSNSMANFCSRACGAYNKTIAIVNQLAEEYNNGWISVEDRLPEVKESHKVLVTDEDGIMAVCYFLEVTKIFKVCWDGEEFQGVVAWQPLPAPYQPKGE